MPTLREPVDGGLVNARDPSTLQPGELQRTDNLIYRPARPSLEPFPNHIQVADAGGTLNGLQHCTFDNGLSLLLTEVAGVYKTTPAASPGVFTSLVTQGAGSSIERIHYDGRHYLFNGIGPNRVLLDTGSVRRHGLAPVTAGLGAAVGTGGNWPLVDDELPAFYEYWATEVYKRFAPDGTVIEEVESTFTGDPVTREIPDDNATVTLNFPAPVNSATTHWRVYRSNSKKLAADTQFPIGFLVGDVPITATSFVDGGGTTTGLTVPTTAEHVEFMPPIQGQTPLEILSFPWTAPGSLLAAVNADDGVVATSANVPSVYITPNLRSVMRVGGFGFTIGSPITDITVEVKGKLIGGVSLSVWLSDDGGNSVVAGQNVPLTSVTSTKSVGGLWGGSLNKIWSAGDFINGLFYVYLQAFGTVPTGTKQVEVDYIKVNIAHGGTTGAKTIPFPITTVRVGDTEYNNGSRGEPPVASFGDIYEDSLVVNDPDNKGAVRYSLEVLVDAFPPEYFLPLTTSEHDEVTAIKTLGHVLIVGLNTYMARIDFLPRAEDAEFSRGRAWDIVQGSHGCVGKRALVSFFIPQKGLFMAHVSRHGVMMTNGYQADTLTDDLDFPSMVNSGRLFDCEFINQPSEYRLLLFYTPPGGTSNTKALAFYYHPTHIKNGKLKVSGPLDVHHTGAVVARMPDGNETFFTASDGKLFQEGSGAGLPYVFQTRDIYPGGEGNASEVTKVLLHQRGGAILHVTPTVMSTNTAPRTDMPITVEAPSRGFVRVPMRVGCEGISFKIETVSGSDGALDYMVLDGVGFRGEAYPA